MAIFRQKKDVIKLLATRVRAFVFVFVCPGHNVVSSWKSKGTLRRDTWYQSNLLNFLPPPLPPVCACDVAAATATGMRMLF